MLRNMHGRKQAAVNIQRRNGIVSLNKLARFLFCFYFGGCLIFALVQYRQGHLQQFLNNVASFTLDPEGLPKRLVLVRHLDEAAFVAGYGAAQSSSGEKRAIGRMAFEPIQEETGRIRTSNDEDLNIANVILTSSNQTAADKRIAKRASKLALRRQRRAKEKSKMKYDDSNESNFIEINSTEISNELKEKRAKVMALRQHAWKVTQMLRNKTVPELRELVEQVQSKFDNDELISIRGFYSSGTNWLRALILHNCKNMTFVRPIFPPFANGTKLDADGLYGWKHGLFLEREITRLTSRKNHKLVIISREAPTWATSAWKMFAMADKGAARTWSKPSQPPMNITHIRAIRSTGNSTQIRARGSTKNGKKTRVIKSTGNGTQITATGSAVNATQIRSTKPITLPGAYGDFAKYINMHKVHESGIYGQYMSVYYDIGYRKDYRIVHDSVLGARTEVYRNWMSLLNNKELANQVYFLRYEDLLASPYIEFQQLLHFFNVENCRVTDEESFDSVRTRVKFQVEDKKITFEGRHPRKEFCSIVTSQTIYENILNKIDRSFELDVLGYAYPETLEEYCHEAMLPLKESLR